jgi:hypothetical protein
LLVCDLGLLGCDRDDLAVVSNVEAYRHLFFLAAGLNRRG